ncbi:MAG TPA: AAA family ATPase, partial [Gaiellaceae bacterium]|nr:AAA family ATPase [Gaiellaceae bacterium]
DEVVRDHACRLVTVLGSAGVGKSRLVKEFISSRANEATIVQGRCLSYGEGLTFFPLMSVISQAAALTGEESPEAAVAKIRSLVEAAGDADLIVQRVCETIGLATPGAGHGGTFWAIGRLFQELASRRPLIAVFDDIQWAEPTFLDLVEAVAKQSRDAPLLLLCMARPDLLELHPAWADADESGNSLRLHLAALTDDDSERLIANLLGTPDLDHEVRTRITETAEGNPLFVEEIVSMLIDEGLLVRQNGSVAASSAWSRSLLPPTIRAVLAARLDRLGHEERALLERGSVEGKVFHRGAVLALTPETDHPRVDEWLRVLSQRELLQPARASFVGDRAFRFHHQLLRDVAYESLSKAARAALHERFADWLEEKAAEREEELEQIVGYHLQQAYRYATDLGPVDEGGRELATRAANRLGSAGLRAHARGDMWGATKLLSSAIAIGAGADVTLLRTKLDDALFETGERRGSKTSLASIRCFWRWPLGHRWGFRQRGAETLMRCASCGKVRRHRAPIHPTGSHTVSSANMYTGGDGGPNSSGGGPA